MTLFLTSDEKVFGNINTRTDFVNSIQQDFFIEDGTKIALKEIFFDARFPTLIDNSYPHVVTIIDGREHNIDEFPSKYRHKRSFAQLFSKQRTTPNATMRIDRDFDTHSYMSEIESNTVIEIHPRLNFAVAYGFLTDLTVDSKIEIVDYINHEMFPFHTVKPLNIMDNGKIGIKSNLNIFMSSNMINILGLSSNQKITFDHKLMPLPSFDVVSSLSKNINNSSIEIESFPDQLARMEKYSDIYTHYRKLIDDKPKGHITVEYFDGVNQKKVESIFNIDIFHQKYALINFRTELKYINRVLLHSFLTKLRDDAAFSVVHSTKEEQEDLDETIRFFLKDREFLNLKDFGGFVTLEKRGEHVALIPFHSPKYKNKFESVRGKMTQYYNNHLLSEVFKNIFPQIKVLKITFNDTLCNLLGLTLTSEQTSYSMNFNPMGQEILFEEQMNYFKAVRMELAKSYKNEIPFALHFFSQKSKFEETSDATLCSVKSQGGNVFLIKKQVEYLAESSFNFYANYPKLIFISATFIQNSLFGSTQKKILNFFPIGENHIGTIHHRFKNPIILKMTPSTVFHIKLFDQNLLPLKAGLGVPTLLGLNKTSQEDMFPVTVLSSDSKNKELYPENVPNYFKNKLSFPLLFSNRSEWCVSLRSLAFPKVKNIYPDQCKMRFEKNGNKIWDLSLDSTFVFDVHNLVFLLNKRIQEIFTDVTEFELPRFFSDKNLLVTLKTNGIDCFMEGSMMKLLGYSYSLPTGFTKFGENGSYTGLTKPNLFIFQPQELMIISNIVEEAFYAQSRPTILRIVPIPNQQEVSGYNYIQFEDHDNIGIKFDRIDDIEIKILNRKGNLVDFVDEGDVKLQLEFKRVNTGK